MYSVEILTQRLTEDDENMCLLRKSWQTNLVDNT